VEEAQRAHILPVALLDAAYIEDPEMAAS